VLRFFSENFYHIYDAQLWRVGILWWQYFYDCFASGIDCEIGIKIYRNFTVFLQNVSRQATEKIDLFEYPDAQQNCLAMILRQFIAIFTEKEKATHDLLFRAFRSIVCLVKDRLEFRNLTNYLEKWWITAILNSELPSAQIALSDQIFAQKLNSPNSIEEGLTRACHYN
jgi:hypothetical protein